MHRPRDVRDERAAAVRTWTSADGLAHSSGGIHDGLRFSENAAKPFLGLGADALAGDEPGRVPLRRAVAEAAHLADDGLGGTSRGRAGGEQIRDGRVHGRIQRLLALDDLVDEPDPGRPGRIEAAAAREQGSGVALADLGDDERADDRRQDPEARLGEPEARPALGDDQVGDRAQAGPATERRAVDPGDDRRRAGVDELERVGHHHRVLLVAFDIELAWPRASRRRPPRH